MATGDVYELSFEYLVDDVNCHQTFYYWQFDGDFGFNDVSVFNEAWVETTKAQWQNFFASEVVFGRSIARKWNTPREATNSIFYTGETGAHTDPDPMTANAPMIARIITDSEDATANGRMFLSGYPKTAIEEGLITSLFITTTVDPLLSALLTVNAQAPQDQVYYLGFIERYRDTVELTPPVFTGAQRLTAIREIYTQKSRRTGRGNFASTFVP